ncbi:MAG TPA: MoxR family ATPase [Limnochordia bacterium]|nr:MoxR family ATPase [Limnochordia bacterium]
MDPAAQKEVLALQGALERIRGEVGRVIVGQRALIDEVLVALLCGGHVLLEGVPGLGKTLLVRTLAGALGLKFARIQFTPDLMPADVTGTQVLLPREDGGRQFTFQPGPIFAQIVLADEINRATPKTQSALLEAMQEHKVTTGGHEHKLREPFFVMATQNPVEMEGTYPLPEAQLDRFFFKLHVGFPSLSELTQIVARTTEAELPEPNTVVEERELLAMQQLVRQVPVASHVTAAALAVVVGTHPDQERATDQVKRYVRFGVSPRGAQSLVLAAKARALLLGRFNASLDDVCAVALPALRHRLILNFEAEAAGVTADQIIAAVLAEATAGAPQRAAV